MEEGGGDVATKVEVSDDDVREKLREVLVGADLQVQLPQLCRDHSKSTVCMWLEGKFLCVQTTTQKKLRKQLEEHFGCCLKDRKPMLKEEVESFLLKSHNMYDAEEEQEQEEEEKPKKKKRTGLGQKQCLSDSMMSFLGMY
jgi:hypothetical protein